MVSDEYQEAVEILKSALEKFGDVLYKYHEDMMQCRDALAKCLVVLRSFRKGSELLIENVPGLEERFGADSIETANEFQKLTDVLVCDFKNEAGYRLKSLDGFTDCSEMKKQVFREKLSLIEYYFKRVSEVYKIYYGKWMSNYEWMLKMEVAIKEYYDKLNYK